MAIKGLWRLNGNSNDASGNGNDGVDTAITYSQANGRLNQGAGFNGSTSKIVKSSPVLPTIGGPLTINVWVKLNAAQSDRKIVNRWKDNSYNWLVSDNNFIAIYAGVQGYYCGWGVLNSGKWYMLTGTYTGANATSALKTYVNGVQVNSGINWPYGSGTSVNTVVIGAGNASSETTFNNFLNGAIDEVIIDNTAWSPAPIKNKLAAILGFF